MGGADDHPDRLSPAERDQYLNRYILEKLRRGEIPRTPVGWQQAAAHWRTQYLQGKTMEKGMDVLFGLTRDGWQREVLRPTDVARGQTVRVDFYLDYEVSPTGREMNAELKSGTLHDRDLEQLDRYRALLQRGETVRLYTRRERDKEMSKQARALLIRMKKEHPRRFIHKPMSERVYARIMEAGARALEKDRRQALAANIAKIPEREPPSMSVERLARDYARHVAQQREQGREVGIEQLRFMHEALREMAAAQTTAERDLAIEDRQGLGLRFHAAQDLEREQQQRLRQQHDARATEVDAVTRELIARERALIAREAERAWQQVHQQQHQQAINLEQGREHFLGLSYALGKIQATEQDLHKAAATRDLPTERIDHQLRQQQAAQRDRDRPVVARIGAIGAVVERETARREHQRLQAAAREQTIARLTPILGPDEARARAATQWVAPPRGAEIGRDPHEILGERDRAARERAAQAKEREARQIQARIDRGMEPAIAELAAFHHKTAPANRPPTRPAASSDTATTPNAKSRPRVND